MKYNLLKHPIQCQFKWIGMNKVEYGYIVGKTNVDKTLNGRQDYIIFSRNALGYEVKTNIVLRNVRSKSLVRFGKVSHEEMLLNQQQIHELIKHDLRWHTPR